MTAWRGRTTSGLRRRTCLSSDGTLSICIQLLRQWIDVLCPNGHNRDVIGNFRPLRWIGSSKRDLLAMPDEVQQVFGFALYRAQTGMMHSNAKPLKGFGSAAVIEVVEDWRGNTYRAVYTVRFARAVYVLHCFQKKSKRGIATPQRDLDVIRERLQRAMAREQEVER